MFVSMAYRGHIDKYGRKHHKDEGLDKAYKDFEGDKGSSTKDWHNHTHNEEEDLAGDNIAKETEGKGNDLGKIRNKLQDTNKEVDGIAKVEEFFEVFEPQVFDPVHLHHNHSDKSEGESGIDIGGWGSPEWYQNRGAMELFANTNGCQPW